MAAPQTFREALRRGIYPFFKHALDKEPVILVSAAAGIVGPILVYLSPLTKYSVQGNASMPWDYPVPVRYEAGKTGPPTSV